MNFTTFSTSIIMFLMCAFKFPDFPVVDSSLSLDDALKGIEIPQDLKSQLVIIDVEYYSFDGKLHRGQLVVNKSVKKNLTEIFAVIKEKRFPVKRVVPVSKYNWNDSASMADNNTSAFNYRFISGTKKLSNHSFGKAIDINPLYNPMIKNGIIDPPGSSYDKKAKGTITADSFLVQEFIKRGWQWGGYWKTLKDYQHFEKL